MSAQQQRVELFHRKFGLPCPDEIDIENLDADRRITLVEEETRELRFALEQRDLIGTIDALCDLLYVVYGTAIAMGINLDPFFAEVHRANMEKVRPPGPMGCDVKLLKPIGWKPPDHQRILDELWKKL